MESLGGYTSDDDEEVGVDRSGQSGDAGGAELAEIAQKYSKVPIHQGQAGQAGQPFNEESGSPALTGFVHLTVETSRQQVDAIQGICCDTWSELVGQNRLWSRLGSLAVLEPEEYHLSVSSNFTYEANEPLKGTPPIALPLLTCFDRIGLLPNADGTKIFVVLLPSAKETKLSGLVTWVNSVLPRDANRYDPAMAHISIGRIELTGTVADRMRLTCLKNHSPPESIHRISPPIQLTLPLLLASRGRRLEALGN